MIRVELPANLRTLANVGREVELNVDGPVTQRSVLDALEAMYPMLRGTIRDQVTWKRRAMLRFFACEEDLSDESMQSRCDLSRSRALCSPDPSHHWLLKAHQRQKARYV